jgi:hypothetical protein
MSIQLSDHHHRKDVFVSVVLFTGNDLFFSISIVLGTLVLFLHVLIFEAVGQTRDVQSEAEKTHFVSIQSETK